MISLVHKDGAADDSALAAADIALEKQDYAAAIASYTAAQRAAPKDLAPKVGIARTRIAKAAPDFGYASAKGNRDVIAATGDLRRITTDPAGSSYGQAFRGARSRGIAAR